MSESARKSSLWETKYKAQFNAVSYNVPHNKQEWVDELIKNFVGTKAQIAEEEKRLGEKFVFEARKARKEYYYKQNEILDDWREEMYEKYNNYPRELFDMAYCTSYAEHHSCGYREVENCIDEYMSKFIKAFQLGRNSNENIQSI